MRLMKLNIVTCNITFPINPQRYFLVIRISQIFPTEYQTSMCAYSNISNKSWKYSVICEVKSFLTVNFQDMVEILKQEHIEV